MEEYRNSIANWNLACKYSRDKGGPGSRDRTLAVKRRKNNRKSPFFCKKIKITIFFLNISSSYAKILGETNFHTREIPRSGSKAEDGERKKNEREKKKD